jgi:hypothetical protein
VIAPGFLLLAASLLLGPEHAVSTPVADASPYEQSISDAVAGGDVALTVWVEPMASVRAMRIDRDGRQLDPEALVLASGNALRERPAVARGADRWLVVWVENETVIGRFVDDDGRIGELLTIQPQTPVSQLSTIHVAFDGERFLVLRSGPSGSLAVRLDAHGAVIGESIPLDVRESGYATVALVAGRPGFVIVFSRWTPPDGQPSSESYTIETLRLDGSGTVIAHETLEGGPLHAAALQAAEDGDGLVIAWGVGGPFNESQIRARHGGESSHVIAGAFLAPRDVVNAGGRWYVLAAGLGTLRLEPVDGGPARTWDIDGEIGYSSGVSLGDRTVLVTSIAPHSPAGLFFDPFAIVVDGALTDIAPRQLIAPEPDLQRDPAVARNRFGESLVTWVEGGIRAVRLDAAGHAIDRQPLLLGNDVYYSAKPSVASDGTGYVVVWQSGHGLVVRRVQRDGTLSPPSRQTTDVVTGTPACICWTGSDYLVGYANLLSAWRWYITSEVHAARVTPDGTFAATPPLLIAGPDANADISCAAGRDATFFLWRGSSVTGALVTAGGAVSGLIPLSPRNFYSSPYPPKDPMPAVAANGDTFAVAWYDEGIVQRAIVTSNGTVTTPNDAAIPATLDVFSDSISLAPHGTGFLLAWGSSDILAVELDSAGRPVDAPFALSATPVAERQAALTGSLVTYMRDTKGTFAPRWRIFTRTISPGPRRRAVTPP